MHDIKVNSGQNVELPKCRIDKTEQIMSQSVELLILYNTVT